MKHRMWWVIYKYTDQLKFNISLSLVFFFAILVTSKVGFFLVGSLRLVFELRLDQATVILSHNVAICVN